MDRCFIRELVRKVEFGCIENGEPIVVAIEGAVGAVNVIFETRLCVNGGHSRLNHLRERYDTFNWLINRPRVRWIPRPKLVLVNEPLWDAIEREELKIIFGKPVDEPIHKSDDEVYPDTQNNPEEIVVRVPSDHNA
ncbi:hypothetical protein Salat_2354600 [Sesamum alatum]|uniref:Uncharacterized protein n=1 Tax=Sesamum alatum TaxID=300844 RepID=A0AAE2CER7_9LAMI|nr:hypothetical protein Salat_2354600 [Sesamum alatum]